MSTPHSGPYPGGPGTVGTDNHLYAPVRPGTQQDPVQAYLQAIEADRQRQVQEYLQALNAAQNPAPVQDQAAVDAYLKALDEQRKSDELNAKVMQDPAYLLWLREQERRISDIEGERNIYLDDQRAQQGIQHSVYADQFRQAKEGLNLSHQNRGMFRSGKRLRDIHMSKQGFDQQRRQYDLGVSQRIAARQRQAAQDIAALERRDAEEQLLARERISAQAAEAAAAQQGI